MDVLGKALIDYQQGNYLEDITTYMRMQGYRDEIIDSIALPYLFRSFDAMPILEQEALHLCQGVVLDVGCGAGSHSLYLQKNGFEVTALDQSKGAIQTCGKRGLKKAVQANIFNFKNTQFDTILLLMNGIGIAENLNTLKPLFQHLKSLLNGRGQILLDSSDIRYMFDEDDQNDALLLTNENYYGEVQFKIEYLQEESEPFGWLFVDFDTLKKVAIAANLQCELVSEGQNNDYLARLTTSKYN